MKALGIVSLVVSAAAAGAQTTSQSQIRHIETSLNHLTVLEFGEAVTTLAIADPDSFQVERHDDKVFVKTGADLNQRCESSNNLDLASTRRRDPRKQPDQRGFSRAVRAYDPECLTPLYLKANIA